WRAGVRLASRGRVQRQRGHAAEWGGCGAEERADERELWVGFERCARVSAAAGL
ncbi:hypothetical protein LTR53_018136, partial [Teratosphaeriaceae sp. CCFEE 6253]